MHGPEGAGLDDEAGRHGGIAAGEGSAPSPAVEVGAKRREPREVARRAIDELEAGPVPIPTPPAPTSMPPGARRSRTPRAPVGQWIRTDLAAKDPEDELGAEFDDHQPRTPDAGGDLPLREAAMCTRSGSNAQLLARSTPTPTIQEDRQSLDRRRSNTATLLRVVAPQRLQRPSR
jgi:hypothetical protein